MHLVSAWLNLENLGQRDPSKRRVCRCNQLEDLTKDHNALLTKFRELTVLMSEAHNKLNSAVAQSGKTMAKDHTKVSS